MSNEWVPVERKKFRKPSQQSDTSKTLAQEMLCALLANPTFKPQAKELEWTRTNCDITNVATRFRCRECAKPRNTGRAGTSATPSGKDKGKGKGKGGTPQTISKPRKAEATKEDAEPTKDIAKTTYPW